MKKLFLPLLLMVAVSAQAQKNPVLTIEGGQVQGVLADVPYMIGFTLNDMGNMSPNIAEFCKVREQKGGKAWASYFGDPEIQK